MINENILEGLKPHYEGSYSPSYFVAIKDIKKPETVCGQESVEFTLCQVNKPLFGYHKKNGNKDVYIPGIVDDCISYEKKFVITGIVQMDDDESYSTKLIGYEGAQSIITDNREEKEIYESHHIEVVEVKLSDKISIKFEDSYERKPFVLVDLEKEDKDDLYKDYDLKFEEEVVKKDDSNVILYSGVNITFNNLKKRKEYPWIRINILEKKEDNTSETGD